ncbi:MAG: translational repressor RegA [Legionella sp.]|uniref:translational repressor RegA n=1 Tax=Legionella sp. TaxID=459 RepID=UPI0028505D3C|nr:translational repressor RegA [Legionella sp.]
MTVDYDFNEKDIFQGVGVEIELEDDQSFLKVKETLTRIGIASKKDKKLFQSCHILHKQGRYVILSFKELFILDGRPSSLTDEDCARRNTIVALLEEWGLVKILDNEFESEPRASMNQIKVIPFKEKNEYELVSKYTIGRTRRS